MSNKRVQQLQAVLADKGVDFFLATHTSDVRWLTGFRGVFDFEQAHLALIPSNDQLSETVLFTDSRYSQALRTLDGEGSWRILDERRPRSAYVAEVIAEQSGKTGGKTGDGSLSYRIGKTENRPLSYPENRPLSCPYRIGIEADLRLDVYRALEKAFTEQEGLTVEFVELPDLITGLRAIKDAEEIELLKAAQAITDAAFTHMLDYLRPGLTEHEVACELEFFMRRSGASGLAFSSIVASAENSAVPHAVPTKRVFTQGDFVLMDFGAKLDDYCSDMTRTVVLGKASEQQRAMYAAALAAQSTCIKALKSGMKGLKAQALAESIIAEHGFTGGLIHGLGHGVGIDIHELPVLAPKIEAELKVGHVVTVEPGVYLEGIGGVRIEDFGIITEQGFEDFTQSPHDLIEL
jgi:Xaa-Pro aminopeptidase